MVINALFFIFKSLLDVNFLLEVGMFSTIYSKKEYEDFVSWAKKENIDISDKVFTNYGKSIIMQDKHHIGREPEEYKDMEEVLGQDINVVYLFEDGEWKEYRWMSHFMSIHNVVEKVKDIWYNDRQIGGYYYVEDV